MIYLNHLLRASAAILVLCVPARADAIADLASFSAFKVDLDKLAGGAVQSARGAPTSFPRGLSVKAFMSFANHCRRPRSFICNGIRPDIPN